MSAYPLPPEQANLGAIRTLRDAFGFAVGLSDHTTEPQRVPAVAVALGARLIEKHFTLDRTLSGPDHSFALEPDDFARMVRTIRLAEELPSDEQLAWVRQRYDGVAAVLGNGQKTIQPAERELYPNDKRSIHAVVRVSGRPPALAGKHPCAEIRTQPRPRTPPSALGTRVRRTDSPSA